MSRNVAFMVLGGLLGVIASFIFWLIYLFQKFDAPVSDYLRFRSAFTLTALIFIVVLIIWFRKDIYNRLKQTYDTEDDDEAE